MASTNYQHQDFAHDCLGFIATYGSFPKTWAKVDSIYSLERDEYWVRIVVMGVTWTIKVWRRHPSEMYQRAYQEMKNFVMLLWGEPEQSPSQTRSTTEQSTGE